MSLFTESGTISTCHALGNATSDHRRPRPLAVMAHPFAAHPADRARLSVAQIKLDAAGVTQSRD